MTKLYSFNDHPEHKDRLDEWRDKWIANAMSTSAMTDADRDVCREAVVGLYAAAGLPAPKHIVFVPSPFVLRFAGGFAAARWYLHHQSKTLATDSATDSATNSADLSNFWVFRDDARAVADDTGVGSFGLICAERAYDMWQGGNQWSAWDSFLTFFRHVAKLPLDYSKYDHWERLSEHSGPRIVHPDFCMISDRPEVLLVDEQNRPHCENGPFCRWRDGSAIYAWHGVFVPARWIEDRDNVDPIEILRAQNVEQRAAGMAILGSRMIPALIAQKRGRFIDDSGSPDIGKLFEVDLPGFSTKGRYLVAECPRNGTIMEGVPLVSDIDNLPIDTALAAQAWRIGDPVSEYLHPERRT